MLEIEVAALDNVETQSLYEDWLINQQTKVSVA